MSAPTADRKATGVFSPTRAAILQRTLRTDSWLKSPLVHRPGDSPRSSSTRPCGRSWQKWYYVSYYHYLTPFYSPCVSKGCTPEAGHSAGSCPTPAGCPSPAVPALPPAVPAHLLLLPRGLLPFVWLSPTACGVARPHAKYTGETPLPLVIQNTHRYAFYAAVIISVINTYDAISFPPRRLRVRLGNIVLPANVIMLWAYTISCDSCRNRRRQAAPLLQTPDPLPALDQVAAQHPAHAARVDHARLAGADRLLHHAGRQRHHL